MRITFKILIGILVIILIATSSFDVEKGNWNSESKLQEVLIALGDSVPDHYISEIQSESILAGEEMVKFGRANLKDGGKSKYISKYYNCTSCHNLEQEDPDLRKSDPDARLTYIKSKNIGFLQGTTFYGMVNRETWYNDDYVKKYGELAVKANKSLRESIQLCAKVCSQGRYLENWELNAILSYCWSLGYTLGDLELTEGDYRKLNQSKGTDDSNKELVDWLKTFYSQKSPATFMDSPPDKKEGYTGITGRANVGKDIFEYSCQTCHHENGESNLVLDDAVYTMRKFKRNFNKEGHFSIYKIIRYGTHPIEGHKPYMPHYTLERMSNQQIEDLRAYIEDIAG